MDRCSSALLSNSSEESDVGGQVTRESFSDDSDSGDDGEWHDVTQVIHLAAKELSLGEMIHPQSFSLYAAMSAIELMEPKMDVGCGPLRDVRSYNAPKTLSGPEVICIMDQLLARFATWLQAHTLPQTVFSCALTQRQKDIPRPELSAYVQTQLATMALIRTIITSEQVSDEEDFISYNFGFALPSLSEPTISKLIKEALHLKVNPIQHQPGSNPNETTTESEDLATRLVFAQGLHSLLTSFATPRCQRVSQSELFIDLAAAKLARIQETHSRYDGDVADTAFDAKFNRHLLANTPPRTAPLFSCEEACKSIMDILAELRVLAHVKERILPPSHAGQTKIPRFSLLCLIHGLSALSALRSLSVVTRSLLKRMLLPGLRESLVCSVEGAALSDMILADIGLTEELASPVLRKQAHQLAPYAVEVILPFCRNRGRQRRYLLRSLASWDDAVVAIFWSQTLGENSDSSEPVGESQNRNVTADETASFQSRASVDGAAGKESDANSMKSMFTDKSPVQTLAHEVTCRLMTQHWFLGFECDLYKPSEYAPIFFYIGYVMTTAANATTSLATAGLDNAELHACRYILYLMDEGRLWLCRALFSLLHGLTLGCAWNYSWRRRPWDASTGGSSTDGTTNSSTSSASPADQLNLKCEELWYEQRFGMMSQLRGGPPYVGYETFIALLQMQDEMLRERSPEISDNVLLRLDDANAGFRTARKAFHRAMEAAKSCDWTFVEDELTALARVAVANSVVIVQLRNMHETAEKSLAPCNMQSSVNFDFKYHRHFPTLTVVTNQ